MRRTEWLIGVLTMVLAGASAIGAQPGGEPSYPAIGVSMEVSQVSPRAYYAQGAAGAATENEGFISNAGFVVTGEGVVVFDALATPSLAAALLAKIRAVTDQPIRKVVVSHYHADHIYGLQVFKDLGAEILAPEGALEYLGSEASARRLEERRMSLSPWVDERTRLVPPDALVEEPTEFTLGEARFSLTPLGAAHSDGDLMMFVEPDRVLFSGDMIFEGRVPFVGDADTKAWLAALATMQGLELQALVPGHGPAASDPNQALSQTRDYLTYLRETMGAAVAEMQEFAAAYEQTDWSRFESMPAFDAANRRNAYAVYLALEEESLSAE